MWWASLEVIQKEFLTQNYKQGGIWVASPLPVLNDKKFFNQLHGWLWSPEGFPYFQNANAGFLPVNNSHKIKKDLDLVSNYKVLNLCQEDGYEPFLMIITPNFQCVLSIVGEKDKKILLMKCDEESLKLLANQKHFQHSGVCIYKNNECLWEYSETVELKMHDLTEKEIINYVDIENPINAAGAYKFESLGCNLFSYVNGSSHTVRGMPLLPLLNALRDLKIIDLE